MTDTKVDASKNRNRKTVQGNQDQDVIDPDYCEVHGSLFYSRLVNKKLFGVLVVMSFGLLVSVGINAFLFMRKEPPVYFASSSDGKLVRMVPLTSPIRSERWLIEWSGRLVIDSLTMDFVHYRDTFVRIQSRFLPGTFQTFANSFAGNGTKQFILDNKLNTSVVLEKSPVIVASGIINGQRAWKIQVPVMITYMNGSSSDVKHFLVKLVVVRIPTSVNPYGVAVSGFKMIEGGASE